MSGRSLKRMVKIRNGAVCKVKPRLRGRALLKPKVNAIILAGGKNSRMGGEDKAFLEIEGRPIIERLIDTLRPLVKEIIVVTNSPKKYSAYSVKIIEDEIPGQGPLMGIYSGLKGSSARYNFVVACDMPFLSGALIEHMIKIKDAYDVVVPEIEEKYHPLFGLYSKNCLPVIRKRLKENRLNVRGIFPELKCRFISKEDAREFDRDLSFLMNVNTKEELSRIKPRL
ncbi:MAG TPA: molybdenum cofactor guanylyltransferase [Candidatus Omnitrophica bacterium]|nr:molybdenum cofactor guanylyltransferase [Candidatus Omnitrophota bacterium]